MGMPDFTETIVSCPRCGRRNRVFRLHRDKGFRCGHCQSDLANPFPSRNKLIAFALDQPWRAGAILIVIGLAIASHAIFEWRWVNALAEWLRRHE